MGYGASATKACILGLEMHAWHSLKHAPDWRPRLDAAAWLLPALLLSCGSELRSTTPTSSHTVQAARRHAPPPRARNICDHSPRRLVVRSLPRVVAYYCSAGACLGPRVPMRLHNCTGRAVVIKQIEVRVLMWPKRAKRWAPSVVYTLEKNSLSPRSGHGNHALGTTPVRWYDAGV